MGRKIMSTSRYFAQLLENKRLLKTFICEDKERVNFIHHYFLGLSTASFL